MNRVWLQFSDDESFGRATASHVGRTARNVLGQAPVFRLALSGGKSPLPFFRALTDPGLFPAKFWARTEIFFADERMVPPDHPDSNFGSVLKHLLRHVPVPAGNIHRMRGELSPEEAAREYADTIRRSVGNLHGDTPALDLVILGMGADGHTASLFPGYAPPAEHPLVAPVPPPTANPTIARLTLTQRTLGAAREVLVLVLGEDKHPALRAIATGSDLPAGRIDVRPQHWYLCPPFP